MKKLFYFFSFSILCSAVLLKQCIVLHLSTQAHKKSQVNKTPTNQKQVYALTEQDASLVVSDFSHVSTIEAALIFLSEQTHTSV